MICPSRQLQGLTRDLYEEIRNRYLSAFSVSVCLFPFEFALTNLPLDTTIIMYIPCEGSSTDWSNYTLIVPAICVGNVGQLTCDLLISTLELHHQGYLYDDSILPIVGSDAFAPEKGDQAFTLTTACQVYDSEKHKLVVVQQRSPVVQGRKKQYVEKITSWIKECGFKEVVILSSIFAHERIDSQLYGSQLRHLSSCGFSERHGEMLDSGDWLALEKRPPPVGDSDGLYLPGAGLAKAMYRKCVELGVACSVLLRFCAEGDNAQDAVQLATYVCALYKWIDLKKSAEKLGRVGPQGWKIPTSWKLMFGSRFEQILYQ